MGKSGRDMNGGPRSFLSLSFFLYLTTSFPSSRVYENKAKVKSKKEEIEAMSGLPEEIYLEILLRVAARSTYDCKCGCKTWLRLISNLSFIKRHLNYTLLKNKPNLMLRRQEGSVNFIYTISKNSELFDETDAIESKYPFQFESNYHVVELLGSCNGLVPLRNEDDYCDEDDYCVKEILRIWNPITRESRNYLSHQMLFCKKKLAFCIWL
ncbi:probable F-box protein At5g47300 [Papaver somniferum]|uniref:probable F-box protein At5g47300 n=1 Tax=Papaver somniferum TaxID=3469 RepID=UPI000E6F77F5|nr:probable F-box protein At5g47300 [Papaver somniferum]